LQSDLNDDEFMFDAIVHDGLCGKVQSVCLFSCYCWYTATIVTCCMQLTCTWSRNRLRFLGHLFALFLWLLLLLLWQRYRWHCHYNIFYGHSMRKKFVTWARRSEDDV